MTEEYTWGRDWMIRLTYETASLPTRLTLWMSKNGENTTKPTIDIEGTSDNIEELYEWLLFGHNGTSKEPAPGSLMYGGKQ